MSGARRAIRKAVGTIGGLIGGNTGRETAQGLVEFAQGLQVATHSLEGFVKDLAPAVTENFKLAMGELSATIGEALLPAFQILSGVIREVADQLAPALQSLAEPLANLVQSIGDVLISGARILGAILPLLQPVFDFLATALKEVTKGLLLFTVYLLKAIKEMEAAQKLVDAFGPAAGGRRAAKAGTPAIKDLQTISKDLALSSANAQGAGGQNNDDFIPQIYELMKDALNNGKTLQDFLTEQFDLLATRLGFDPSTVGGDQSQPLLARAADFITGGAGTAIRRNYDETFDLLNGVRTGPQGVGPRGR